MGIKTSPDLAQSMIKKILGDLNIETYMDDLGLWSKGTFDEYMIIIN